MPNSFSDAVALWSFDSDLTDSIGTNHFSAETTTANVTIDNATYFRGTGSLRLNNDAANNSAGISIDNTNLNANNPIKAANGEVSWTMAYWYQFTKDSAVWGGLASKWWAVTSGRSFQHQIRTSNKTRLLMGSNGGVDATILLSSTVKTVDNWYHAIIGYDTATNNMRYKSHDSSGNVISNLEVALTSGWSNTTAQFGWGIYNGTTSNTFSGRVDELVIFNRYITCAECTSIVNDTYSVGGGVASLSFGLSLDIARKLQT